MKTILVDAVNTFVVETEKGFQIYEPLYNLLETFPHPKIILTGANDEQFKMFGLDTMPYPVFTLKHDPEKVDPDYYVRMLAQYKLTPETVVYFEHNPTAVESAQSVGIPTFFYDKEVKDIEGLKQFLAENL